MSMNNNILNILNLKEENLFFDENFITKEKINGIICQIYHATLKYKPKFCKKCAVVYKNYNMIVHSYEESNILLPKVSGMKTYLRVRKQRYLCKECGETFVLDSNITDEGCFISSNVKHQIALDATKKRSETDIAKDNSVSHNTVARVIDSSYSIPKPFFNYLPKHLGFDEFKSVKSADGAMSFIFSDLDKHKTIDIVENRQLFNLLKYFARYSHKARASVKTIVIDMYKPYMSLIKQMFPNATIIIDKFHIVQLINRSLNKTRIKLMNKFSRNSKEYGLFKRNWKRLLKRSEYINKTKYKRWSKTGDMMTEYQLIEYLINLDKTFKNTYNLYQSLLFSIQYKKVKYFESLLDSKHDDISIYMKTALKSLRENKKYIISSLKSTYTNGFVEGFNNKIKVIKRIAFGYRSFLRFKKRILIISNLITYKKTLNHSI